MASRPVEAATFAAYPQRTARDSRPFRHSQRQIRRRHLEQPVVDNTAGKRRVLPVDVKSDAQSSCGFVDAASRKQHDRRSTRDDRGKMPVSSQQDSILISAARGEFPIANAPGGNDSIVTAARSHRPRPCSISSHKNRVTSWIPVDGDAEELDCFMQYDVVVDDIAGLSHVAVDIEQA